MSKMPPIPKEQRRFSGEAARDRLRSAEPHRRDQHRHEDVQSGQPGDADVNIEKQGRFGNMRQNLTPQHRVQDR